jgi:hypothetical protein
MKINPGAVTMKRRTKLSAILIATISSCMFNAGIINSANATKNENTAILQDDSRIIYGKVTEVIDVTGYTYAEIDTGKEKVWAAGPPTPLKVGDMIGVSSLMPMQNFHSKSLGRDFSVIYFINSYVTDKQSSATASPHGQIKQSSAIEPIEGIEKVKGGNTIAEIYSEKSKLGGKTVRVRGKVTKFTANVMGRNWLHIRDSSTLDDLTVTTDSTAAIGDVVLAEGKLELDKDFNYGYLYPVIIEHASIKKE